MVQYSVEPRGKILSNCERTGKAADLHVKFLAANESYMATISAPAPGTYANDGDSAGGPDRGGCDSGGCG